MNGCLLQKSHSFTEIPFIWLTIQNLSSTDSEFFNFIIFIIHGLGHLTCSSIDALTSFPGASRISSSLRFVVEGVFWESGVVHSFKMVVPVLFVFGSHVLYSRDL